MKIIKKKLLKSLIIGSVIFPRPSFAMKLDYFDKDIVVVLNDTIKVVLSLVGGITLLFLIIGGVLYISSGSNPELQGKAKKTITYATIGLILSLLSYAMIVAIDKVSV